MTTVHPAIDSDDNESVTAEQPRKIPPAYVVETDKFVPQGLIPGANLDKLQDVKTLKIRMNKTAYNATSEVNLPNRFVFLDENDRQLFIGHESSELICRCAFGRTRSYNMSILSENNEIVLEILKSYSFFSTFGCCSFIPKYDYGHCAKIIDPKDDTMRGSITQQFELSVPYYQIRDAENVVKFDIISRQVGCCLPFVCPNRKGNMFTIYLPGRNYEIGYIGVENSTGNSYLIFPEKCDLDSRVLFLAALAHIHILFLTNNFGC